MGGDKNYVCSTSQSTIQFYTLVHCSTNGFFDPKNLYNDGLIKKRKKKSDIMNIEYFDPNFWG